MIRRFGVWTLAAAAILFVAAPVAVAQDAGEPAPPPPVVAAPGVDLDREIDSRLERVFDQIPDLEGVGVDVREGVVHLTGEVANEPQAERAVDLASRLEGVLTVEDDIERTLDVEGNLNPALERLRSDMERWMRASPLALVALGLFLGMALLGHLLASWTALWRRMAPNPFLGELIAQSFRVAAIVLGLVLALSLMGATALMGAILGGAGVLGLAIGFAVRDTLENYISSIMLSLRQPFRANDHVVINEHEGRVVRLTSRATVLMTLDGNHLRIPNSAVFKAVILNYTRNPERRFEFDLGVDAEDDPAAAMTVGLDAISALPFVLDDPKPDALIKTVGDSNIVLTFHGWVNQSDSDFNRARSLAIRAAKMALEDKGFTLPEPIYRLRFDQPVDPGAVAKSAPVRKPPAKPAQADENAEVLDVKPDAHLDEIVREERAESSESDLLDNTRPVE